MHKPKPQHEKAIQHIRLCLMGPVTDGIYFNQIQP